MVWKTPWVFCTNKMVNVLLFPLLCGQGARFYGAIWTEIYDMCWLTGVGYPCCLVDTLSYSSLVSPLQDKCRSGFINERQDVRKLQCPNCQQFMCFQCKKPVWLVRCSLCCETTAHFYARNQYASELYMSYARNQGMDIKVRDHLYRVVLWTQIITCLSIHSWVSMSNVLAAWEVVWDRQ